MSQYFDWTTSLKRFVRFDTARSEDVNDALDELTAGLDNLDLDVNRSIKLPIGTADQTLALGSGARANKILAFDGSGNVTVTTNTVDSIATNAAAAAASASTASTQAGIATTQAGIATTQAGIATTQAGISTTGASTSTTQAGIATTGADTATAQAVIATTQAGISTTQAGISTTQAGNASASAATASGHAATATTQAGIATTQAGIATTQAGISTTQAGLAAASAVAADASADAAAASAVAADASADAAAASAASIAGGPVTSVNSLTGVVVLAKSDIGLGNVDNTSDANKPVSTATQTALNAKQATLVSGTSIKTVNSTSLLGSGDVAVQATLVSGTNIKTIGGVSVLGSGDLAITAGITATGTAAESVVAGDPLAWRSSDSKLEKVKRVRQTPWATPDKHLIVVCPYVDGNVRINKGYQDLHGPQYSILDSTVLCVWFEMVLDISGTQTAKQRACVGLLQDDGSVSWGAPVDVTNTASSSTSAQFICVVLSSTLAGIVTTAGVASTAYYTIVNISGSTITSASSSGTATASRNLYLDRRGLFRISATHAGLVCDSAGNNTASSGVVINYTSTGSLTFDDNSSLRTFSSNTNDFCGGNSIGGRLSVNGSGPGAMYIFRTSGTTFAETTVVGSNVQAHSCALGFDGTRYFVATYISSADSRTYAVCIDSTGWSVGTPVQVSTTGFWRMGIWYDADTSTFYMVNSESSGSIYPITRTTGTTLSVGALVTGLDPYRGRSAPSFYDYGRIGYTQCGTSKFFAVRGDFTVTGSTRFPGICLVPYETTNTSNYVGIADAAAATNATVTYTPHGGVTTRMTGLTPFREALLSHAGVVGASGFQRAGLALSATAMQVHTPQNDFSKVEVWTSSGTWTCPTNVTKVYLKEVTGGGAGAFCASIDRYAQGGETVSGYLDVVPGNTYTITIGAGGTSSVTASSVTAGGNTVFGPVMAMGGLHDANSSRSSSLFLRKTPLAPRAYVQNCTVRRKGGTMGFANTNEQFGGGSGAEATDFGRAGGYYYDGSTNTINGTQGVVIFAY